MIGILVHGNNHFIVEGPPPDASAAEALARHWTLIRIGGTTPVELAHWKIISKAFREDLQWAVIVPADTQISPAVVTLLSELATRGIPSTNGADGD